MDLSPKAISNHDMGKVFEELIRRFAESSNETAGEHFTPRDIVHLTTSLVFMEDDDALFEHPIASINKLIELTGLTAATVGKVLDTLQYQYGIVKEITGQRRNRVFAYTAYIEILNQE